MAALSVIGGHDQIAHARMLEERPTAASGDPLDPCEALLLLQSGQIVNLATGPEGSHAPGRVIRSDGVPLVAAQVAAELGRSLGVPTELIMDGRQGLEVETAAAEVLAVSQERGEVVLSLDGALGTIEPGHPAVVDFTDATGTYYLAGIVASAHGAQRPRVSIAVRHASHVQLRRFVRVPVLISPFSLEVQAMPGQWRAVRGEVIDISLGGLGLLVDEPLLTDARIQIDLELPGRFGDLSVRGRVVPPPGPAEAQAGQRRGAGIAYRSGVAFDPITIDDLRCLQRALYHRQVELRRLADPAPARRAPRPNAAPATAERRSGWQFWRR